MSVDDRKRLTDPSLAGALWQRLLCSFDISVGPDSDTSVIGRLLLASTILSVLAFTPLLHPTSEQWLAVGLTCAVLVAALIASMHLDWRTLPRSATLVFPALVGTALIAISVAAPGLMAPQVGILTLAFACIGLTQRPGSGFYAVPPAAVTFVIANHAWNPQIAIRVVVACSVWLFLSELLSRLTVRQRDLSAALRAAAHRDVLTGVPNRRDMQVRMTVTGAGDALVMCDLDHFKALNERIGHLGADQVLADFGALLSMNLRGDDYCARYGGEEFVVVLPQTNGEEAARLVERLRLRWRTMQPEVTFSAGIAVCRADRAPFDTLAAADAALYSAKQAGRDCDRSEGVHVG